MKTRLLPILAFAACSIAAFGQLPSGTSGPSGGAVPIQTDQIGGAGKDNKLHTLQLGLPTPTGASGLVIGDYNGSSTAAVSANQGLVSELNLPFWIATISNETAINTLLWNSSVSTYTIAQAGGLIQLNSGASVGTSKYAIVSSNKVFAISPDLPLDVNIEGYAGQALEANAVIEIGLGTVSAATAPTDGVFFRWNGATNFEGVVQTGGVANAELDLPMPVPSTTAMHQFRFVIRQGEVAFYVDGLRQGSLAIGNSAGSIIPLPVESNRQPLIARVYSGATAPSAAPTFYLGNSFIYQKDMNVGVSRSTLLAEHGLDLYQSPLTTFAQTANWANSTSATSATLSNTTAGYGPTLLGGRYAFASIAGAATDYALFAWQNSAGYQAHITHVRISAIVTGAANATTATILNWGVGVNSSAVSLATTDGTDSTWAPRRIALGQQGFLTSAAIGTVANDIDVTFDPPLVVDSGRYFHVILQVPVMTATSSEIITGDVLVHGFSQ